LILIGVGHRRLSSSDGGSDTAAPKLAITTSLHQEITMASGCSRRPNEKFCRDHACRKRGWSLRGLSEVGRA
jgi:hypothetical protein